MKEILGEEKFINIIDAGVSDYESIYGLQKALVHKRRAGLICDTLILAEHTPVFTIGRTGSRKNLLIDEDTLKEKRIGLFEVDRGGDITFHGPGQLLLYPIIDLTARGRDLHKYLRMLEEIIVDLLSRYNIVGSRIPGATGVWVDRDRKIASIGIGVSRWVTYHGLSININTPLYYFDMIRPCGLAWCRMTSLESILKRQIDMKQAKRHLIESYEKISSMDKKTALLHQESIRSR